MPPANHPGIRLQTRYLLPLGISQNRLARELGVPPRRINEIVLGKRAITADTAVRLARFFGNDASEWMQMQAEYDIQRAFHSLGSRIRRIYPLNTREHQAHPTVTGAGSSTMPETVSAPTGNIRKRILR